MPPPPDFVGSSNSVGYTPGEHPLPGECVSAEYVETCLDPLFPSTGTDLATYGWLDAFKGSVQCGMFLPLAVWFTFYTRPDTRHVCTRHSPG